MAGFWTTPWLASALAHEFGAQHEALDALVAAIDLLGIAGEADRADDRALLQGGVGSLDLEVLDQGDRVAVGCPPSAPMAQI
jgi:hypothetical protein